MYDARREQSGLLLAPRRGRYYSPAVTANNGSAVAPSHVDVIPQHGVFGNEMFRHGLDTAAIRYSLVGGDRNLSWPGEERRGRERHVPLGNVGDFTNFR